MNNQQELPEAPSPSYWPLTLAFSVLLLAAGLVSNLVVSIFGLVLLIVSIAGWTMENRKLEEMEGQAHD